MTMRPEYKPFVDDLIELCIREDIGDGDHTSLACIPADEHGRMRLLCKQEGVIAGIEIAQIVLRRLDPEMHFEQILHDGDRVRPGDVAFYVSGRLRSLLQAERIIVVDNAAANDDIKKGALKLAKPQGVRLNVFTVERALAKMDKLNTLGERVMFVFGNTAEMLQFCQGYKLDAINLGATANHDGADQVGGKDSSVFLDATQKADVNQLLDMGIRLYVQQTPTYQSVDIDAKL